MWRRGGWDGRQGGDFTSTKNECAGKGLRTDAKLDMRLAPPGEAAAPGDILTEKRRQIFAEAADVYVRDLLEFRAQGRANK